MGRTATKKMLNSSEISKADEKCAILEWLSPLNRKNQAIRIGRVIGAGYWLLLTSEFARWSESGDGTPQPVLFCYGDPSV